MRFNLATICMTALAGTALARSTGIDGRADKGNSLSFFSGLGSAPTSDLLGQALGPRLGQVQSGLSFNLADKLRDRLDDGVPLSVLVAIVEALGELLGGADIDLVNRHLGTNSNGWYGSLDDALGVVNIADFTRNLQ
ncbi:hypothetical protein NM208_g3005 [Fusarium decemcellulare]|uniref:Uncharacterized protein n=1 Tax=Fusarium decemcellulare TaxID=57161 RepID=A0ACC1SQZ4_9HYPO|nr:hypothetical protein NM208_g3005 [Fusarium decemcellulare]